MTVMVRFMRGGRTARALQDEGGVDRARVPGAVDGRALDLHAVLLAQAREPPDQGIERRLLQLDAEVPGPLGWLPASAVPRPDSRAD